MKATPWPVITFSFHHPFSPLPSSPFSQRYARKTLVRGHHSEGRSCAKYKCGSEEKETASLMGRYF